MSNYYSPGGKESQINIRVSDNDLRIIRQRMAQAGINNMSEYIRHKAKDGMIYNIKFDELDGILHEMKKQGVNINQLAYVANSTGFIDVRALEEVKENQDKLWAEIHSLILKMSKL